MSSMSHLKTRTFLCFASWGKASTYLRGSTEFWEKVNDFFMILPPSLEQSMLSEVVVRMSQEENLRGFTPKSALLKLLILVFAENRPL